MKNSANSNMYESALEAVQQAYADHLQCEGAGYVGIVSSHALGDEARKALESSAEHLGFGNQSCSYVTVSADEASLGEHDLFMALEGMDPLCVVVTDASAAALLSRAYRQEVPTDRFCRLFGRNAVAFRDFEEMLHAPEDKQRAWALLKKLA